MVRKSGGQQSETVCPTVGTHNNIDDVEEDDSFSSQMANSLLVDEAQLRETEAKSGDVSAPLLPLITELGFTNNYEDSQ
jgi:hypothetical protein